MEWEGIDGFDYRVPPELMPRHRSIPLSDAEVRHFPSSYGSTICEAEARRARTHTHMHARSRCHGRRPSKSVLSISWLTASECVGVHGSVRCVSMCALSLLGFFMSVSMPPEGDRLPNLPIATPVVLPHVSVCLSVCLRPSRSPIPAGMVLCEASISSLSRPD